MGYDYIENENSTFSVTDLHAAFDAKKEEFSFFSQ